MQSLASNDDRNTLLTKDFLEFIENEFTDDNRPIVFLENCIESYTDLSCPWIWFSTKVFHRMVTTLGETRRFLRQGTILMNVSVPVGIKTALLNEIVYKIINHYEGKMIAGVQMADIETNDSTLNNNPAWYQRAIRILYRYYTIK